MEIPLEASSGPDSVPLNIHGNVNVIEGSSVQATGPEIFIVAINLLLGFTVIAFVINIFIWLSAHGNESQASRGKTGMAICLIAIMLQLFFWALITWYGGRAGPQVSQ